MMKYALEDILRGKDASEIANRVHQAYVNGNPTKDVTAANSYQHFNISNIEQKGEGQFTVTFDSGESTAPMSGEDIVNVLKGGKFKTGGKVFNTKEALMEERIEKGLDALSFYLKRDTVQKKPGNQ